MGMWVPPPLVHLGDQNTVSTLPSLLQWEIEFCLPLVLGFFQKREGVGYRSASTTSVHNSSSLTSSPACLHPFSTTWAGSASEMQVLESLDWHLLSPRMKYERLCDLCPFAVWHCPLSSALLATLSFWDYFFPPFSMSEENTKLQVKLFNRTDILSTLETSI